MENESIIIEPPKIIEIIEEPSKNSKQPNPIIGFYQNPIQRFYKFCVDYDNPTWNSADESQTSIEYINTTFEQVKSSNQAKIKRFYKWCVDHPSYVFWYIFLFLGLLYWMQNSDYSRYELDADFSSWNLEYHTFRTLGYLVLLISLPLIIICTCTGIRSKVVEITDWNSNSNDESQTTIGKDFPMQTTIEYIGTIMEEAKSSNQAISIKRLYKWCVDHPSYVFWYIFLFLGLSFWMQSNFSSRELERHPFLTLFYSVLLISLPFIIICISTGHIFPGIRSMVIKTIGWNSSDEPLFYKPEKNSTLPKDFWEDSIEYSTSEKKNSSKINVDDLA